MATSPYSHSITHPINTQMLKNWIFFLMAKLNYSSNNSLFLFSVLFFRNNNNKD